MNSFKVQFLALEATVKELEEKIQKLEGTTPSSQGSCHYVSFEREAGELTLDCMDTFRFVYTLPPNQMPNYNPAIHIGANFPNPRTYIYTLINPNEDLKNYCNSQARMYNLSCTTYHTNDTRYGLRIETETPPEMLEKTDIQLGVGNVNDQPCITHPFPKRKELKDALEKKFFTFSKRSYPTKSDFGDFIHRETIEFKEEYEILPHVSFFLTPLDKTNLICKITEITKKSVTFELSYVNPILDSPPDAVLHWQIQGVKKPSQHVDLLL
jgi:hypothetical protein